MDKYILTTDDDGHWFVIPADKQEEWSKYCEEVETYWQGELDSGEIAEHYAEPVQPDWADEVGGAPSRVRFSDYEIGG